MTLDHTKSSKFQFTILCELGVVFSIDSLTTSQLILRKEGKNAE